MNYGLLNNPVLNLGAGLLAAGQSPGGTLGMGLQQGLQNVMLGQQFATQNKLNQARLAEFERQQKQREAAEKNWRDFMGTPTVNTPIQPGSNAEFENFDNPNYQGGVSGGLLSTPGTGLAGRDPEMAHMLGLLGPERGSELMGQMMLQGMKGQDPTTAERQLIAAGYVPGTPEFQQAMNNYMFKPDTVVNMAPNAPQGWMYNDPNNPRAGLSRIPGGEFDQAQVKAAGFANRMAGARANMSGVKSTYKDFDPANMKDHAALSVPFGNYAVSEPFQLYRQAQEDWVRAKLRLESGAVIGDEEMAREISTYFPMPGDKPATIEQKRKARETAENNLIEESQGAYDSKFATRTFTVDGKDITAKRGSDGRYYYEAPDGKLYLVEE